MRRCFLFEILHIQMAIIARRLLIAILSHSRGMDVGGFGIGGAKYPPNGGILTDGGWVGRCLGLIPDEACRFARIMYLYRAPCFCLIPDEIARFFAVALHSYSISLATTTQLVTCGFGGDRRSDVTAVADPHPPYKGFPRPSIWPFMDR